MTKKIHKIKTVAHNEQDKTPKYTVKAVAKIMNINPHTVRYYDNEGLIPFATRTDSNIRLFSDYDLVWFKMVHCLRCTNLSIAKIKEYIDLCLEGSKTIKKRAEIIFAQEKILKENIKELQQHMKTLQFKKKYYMDLINKKSKDLWNPVEAY